MSPLLLFRAVITVYWFVSWFNVIFAALFGLLDGDGDGYFIERQLQLIRQNIVLF